MEILFLTGNLPYPPSDGWKIRVLSLIRSLAQSHQVSVVSFVRTTEDPSAIEGLQAYCAGVWAIQRNPRYSPWRLFLGLVGPWPFPVLHYQDQRMANLLSRLLHARTFDIIQAQSLEMAQYCLPLRRPTILDLHNVESMLIKRYAERERHPFKRVYAEVTWRKLAAYERNVCERFTRCVTCSDEDQALLREHAAGARVSVIPNGVDLEAYRPDGMASVVTDRLVFVGRMDYHANVDGIRWFCKEVLPRVRACRPNAVLQIVGGYPTAEVKQLAVSGLVEVTGFVEDVRPYVRAAAVVVVPLRVGGGTRLKILEALAMGKAVVSTSLGAEGLSAVSGKEIVLADCSRSFADRVIEVLASPQLRSSLGMAGRRLVEERYSWKKIGECLEEVYQSACTRATNHEERPGWA